MEAFCSYVKKCSDISLIFVVISIKSWFNTSHIGIMTKVHRTFLSYAISRKLNRSNNIFVKFFILTTKNIIHKALSKGYGNYTHAPCSIALAQYELIRIITCLPIVATYNFNTLL
jgi:hypothetical protein